MPKYYVSDEILGDRTVINAPDSLEAAVICVDKVFPSFCPQSFYRVSELGFKQRTTDSIYPFQVIINVLQEREPE